LLWENAPENANIGLRCGGANHLLVIDCDEKNKPGTFDNTSRYLAGLGININDSPIVRTASRIGKHIYLQCLNSPGGSYSLLSPEYGSGEVRHSDGCYVVAPPSIYTGGGEYRLINGDFSALAKVDFSDILPLLKKNKPIVDSDVQQLYQRANRRAKQLLLGGETDQFPSRSERDSSLMVSLINSGFSEDSIKVLMKEFKFGKYGDLLQQNPQIAQKYFSTSYANAKTFAENNMSDGRRLALNARNWAESIGWKGKTGISDRAVFLAHCDIAYRSGKQEYHASCRELAELAAMSVKGVSKVNGRLLKKGMISVIIPGMANQATVYSIMHEYTLPQSQTVRECVLMQNHDAFRRSGLGKSSFLIWKALQEGPSSIADLVVITGRVYTTVKRNLERMSKVIDFKTGEVISMVGFDGVKYEAKADVDLDRIAELLGTKGSGEKQKELHRKQRLVHNKLLRDGSNEAQ
ncbi:MAG: bifunctional DNA primase/polymerase, partial [Smithella sp.]